MSEVALAGTRTSDWKSPSTQQSVLYCIGHANYNVAATAQPVLLQCFYRNLSAGTDRMLEFSEF
jgi:hypothetical protein